MNFTLNRDKVVNSNKGHVIEFVKGVPTYVPKEVWEEALAVGAQPVEEINMDADEVKKSNAPNGEERELLITAALEQTSEKNMPNDFTATGVPKTDVISDIVGFKVKADELKALWVKLQSDNDD